MIAPMVPGYPQHPPPVDAYEAELQRLRAELEKCQRQLEAETELRKRWEKRMLELERRIDEATSYLWPAR